MRPGIVTTYCSMPVKQNNKLLYLMLEQHLGYTYTTKIRTGPGLSLLIFGRPPKIVAYMTYFPFEKLFQSNAYLRY